MEYMSFINSLISNIIKITSNLNSKNLENSKTLTIFMGFFYYLDIKNQHFSATIIKNQVQIPYKTLLLNND